MQSIMIREWKMSDVSDLVKMINNKKITDNMRDGIPIPYTEKDAEIFISSVHNADKDTQYVYAITSEDKIAGNIGIYRKTNIYRYSGELGYYISENYWNQGIATEAIKQICELVFLNTDIVRIIADPFSYNIASCRALEKAGFLFEGLLKKNAFKNGKFIDMKLYSLVKDNI
ncbi:MAG: GNAT family N-acetyltransferase [Candidatus Cloacimonetes bacterium]|nr:GNAT family N-acetyltransferase [Candidatus Cloacimonadota bacterium]